MVAHAYKSNTQEVEAGSVDYKERKPMHAL